MIQLKSSVLIMSCPIKKSITNADAYRPNIACKAFRTFTEVEEVEYYHSTYHRIDQFRLGKQHYALVYVRQYSQHYKRIATALFRLYRP